MSGWGIAGSAGWRYGSYGRTVDAGTGCGELIPLWVGRWLPCRVWLVGDSDGLGLEGSHQMLETL